MNKNFFQKNKNILSIVAAILAFAVITLIYFSPVLQGKRIKQHDIEMHLGMSQEINQFHEATGEQTLWTNAPFGGMPAWNISVSPKGNLTNPVYKGLSLGFPHPIGSVFICMLGFFVLLLVLDCGFWISFIGAIAYGFTSYLFIVIGAGHNAKAMAMAYMAPVIAGVLLAYKGKYLWGWLLTAFAMAFEVRTNHLQITYYLALIIVILVIAELISDIKNKKLGHFFKASVGLAVAAIIGVLTCSTALYGNYEFGKETTRGKPVLASEQDNQTTGLDRDYITQWSYGKGETWTLLIPNAKGGASAYIGKQNPALDKADRQFKDTIAQQNAYWGDQPMTSGPVYVGAIVVFLFVLGALTVKGKLKWALLIATLLSILLSWGKNFMGFTNFFLDYIPGYDKFRAVSMTLVIAEITMPLLGFLGLAELMKDPDGFQKNIKKFYIALGITAGICLLFYLAPKTFFSFLSQGEAEQFAAMSKGKDGAVYAQFASQLEDVRVAIFRKDALRSLLFIILAAVPLFLYGRGKLKGQIAFPILAVLVLVDMFPIDKRYLNNDKFVSKEQYSKPFTASAADQYILNDNDLDFRVADITKDMFNDASTCYFHKSLGGYSGAKLRRYQDVISQYLGSELNQLRGAKTAQDLMLSLSQQKVINMLNTKYVIFNPNAQPFPNANALGNAWVVNDIRWVSTPNEEIDAIAETNLAHAAIINREFAQQVGNYQLTDSIVPEVILEDYQPNKLCYKFRGASTGATDANYLVVFSEIWTEKGWKMYVDGQEQPLLRANYILRAALIPGGEHDIVMEYAPKAYKVGNTVSFVSSLIMILGLIGALIYTFKPKKEEKA
ncbi:MAG: YfhO family protein [Bacteroidales bacterium]|nr:YfhO family protein [Bacteroidales bacterium]MBR6227911.1 YfhO family protein [Bacteroidales bacterium]